MFVYIITLIYIIHTALPIYTGLKSYERRSFVAAADVVEALLTLIKSHHCTEDKDTAALVDKGDSIGRKLIPRVLNIGGPAGLTRLQVAEILCGKLRVPLLVDASQQHKPPPTAIAVSTTASSSATITSATNNKNDDGEGDADVWRIYDQTQEPGPANTTNSTTLTTPANTSTLGIKEVIILTSTQPLQTPLHLTMSVTDTEIALNMRFRPLSEYIVDCIEVD